MYLGRASRVKKPGLPAGHPRELCDAVSRPTHSGRTADTFVPRHSAYRGHIRADHGTHGVTHGEHGTRFKPLEQNLDLGSPFKLAYPCLVCADRFARKFT